MNENRNIPELMTPEEQAAYDAAHQPLPLNKRQEIADQNSAPHADKESNDAANNATA